MSFYFQYLKDHMRRKSKIFRLMCSDLKFRNYYKSYVAYVFKQKLLRLLTRDFTVKKSLISFKIRLKDQKLKNIIRTQEIRIMISYNRVQEILIGICNFCSNQRAD